MPDPSSTHTFPRSSSNRRSTGEREQQQIEAPLHRTRMEQEEIGQQHSGLPLLHANHVEGALHTKRDQPLAIEPQLTQSLASFSCAASSPMATW